METKERRVGLDTAVAYFMRTMEAAVINLGISW
jgi:hypothetical protein